MILRPAVGPKSNRKRCPLSKTTRHEPSPTQAGEGGCRAVTEAYKAWDNAFTGKILKVAVEVKPMGEADKAAALSHPHVRKEAK